MPAFAGMTLLFLIKIPTRTVTPAKAGVPFVAEIIANDYSLISSEVRFSQPRRAAKTA
jgi:hypothetical protein